VLLALGVDLEQVRQEIARNHQPSPRLVVQSVLPTRSLRRAIIVQDPSAVAGEPTQWVDTQHLVLPITEDGHEPATRVLEVPRVKPLAIREAVRSFRADSSA
jgi:ATP-dependent Clp protease ATP-binding subunit ClpA